MNAKRNKLETHPLSLLFGGLLLSAVVVVDSLLNGVVVGVLAAANLDHILAEIKDLTNGFGIRSATATDELAKLVGETMIEVVDFVNERDKSDPRRKDELEHERS